jgi:hypothetical protein
MRRKSGSAVTGDPFGRSVVFGLAGAFVGGATGSV